MTRRALVAATIFVLVGSAGSMRSRANSYSNAYRDGDGNADVDCYPFVSRS